MTRSRRRWSISARLFVFQLVAVIVLTGAATVWIWADVRSSAEQNAAEKCLAVASAIADNPFVVDTVSQPDPSTALEPYALHLMATTSTDFITVMAPDRTRYTHPNASEIGKPFVGTIEPALEGKPFTETYSGTLGPSVRAVVPVRGSTGAVIALVAVGVTLQSVSGEVQSKLPVVFGVALAVVLLAGVASWLLSRYLRRVTWGRGPEELIRMFSYYEGVLHSIHEGIVLVDAQQRLVLHNDRAAELLALDPGALANGPRAVAQLGLPDVIRELLESGARVTDEIVLTSERTLVINQEIAVSVGGPRPGRRLGTVTTFQDRTDLQRLSGELQSTRTMADALRAQTHEFSNRLHTMTTLIELGQPSEAIALATGESRSEQHLTDQLLASANEPVLAALLLGKSAQARERGVRFSVFNDEGGATGQIPAADMVTIVGNLIDNALDAASSLHPPDPATGSSAASVDVVVLHDVDAAEIAIEITDNGPGMPDVEQAFSPGFSSKESGPFGRGLGLGLVSQAVNRLGGTIAVSAERGTTVTVTLPLQAHMPTNDAATP